MQSTPPKPSRKLSLLGPSLPGEKEDYFLADQRLQQILGISKLEEFTHENTSVTFCRQWSILWLSSCTIDFKQEGKGQGAPFKRMTWACVCVCVLVAQLYLFVTAWAIDHQDPLSIEFSRQEYWNEYSFSSPGDLPDPGIKPMSPALQILYHLSHQGSPGTVTGHKKDCLEPTRS